MGQNKRYFWFKLFDDFFQSKRIKKLRNLAGGDTYTIIYLKMQLKALKTDGYLYFDGVMNDFAEELALDIDENPEDVKVTIQYLLSVGLIESSESGEEWYLTYMQNCIGSETAGAKRSRAFRQRQKEQKALQQNANETLSERQPNAEIDIEKEIDIDKDIDNPPLSPLGEKESHDYNKHTNVENVKYVLNNGLYKEWKYIQVNPSLWECIKEWMEYKDLRKPRNANHYVNDKSINTFLDKFVKNSKKYGVNEVIEVVRDSMSQCYQGITWNNLEKKYRNTAKGSAFDHIDIGE